MMAVEADGEPTADPMTEAIAAPVLCQRGISTISSAATIKRLARKETNCIDGFPLATQARASSHCPLHNPQPTSRSSEGIVPRHTHCRG